MSVRVGVMGEHGVRVGKLARQLRLPLASGDDAEHYQYLLVRTRERLELRDNVSRRARPFYVDISSLDRQRTNLSRRQPLARAIGKRSRTIIDATAGLGHDALLLALMGYEVTAIERSPIIAALLRDGIMRAQEQEKLAPALGDRFMLLAGDARKLLPTLETCADVIYLDPMYPPSAKRSALPKKVMRTLRDIVGDDADTGELLSVALKHAQGRVVVKRPSSAMPISTPSTSYRGKMVRYDVYITPA